MSKDFFQIIKEGFLIGLGILIVILFVFFYNKTRQEHEEKEKTLIENGEVKGLITKAVRRKGRRRSGTDVTYEYWIKDKFYVGEEHISNDYLRQGDTVCVKYSLDNPQISEIDEDRSFR